MAADTIFSLNEAQFHQIRAALNGQQGWWPVVSVFVSALLAMVVGIIVGILLDSFRSRKEKANATQERQKHEIHQINAVISRIVFNIERLLHTLHPKISFPITEIAIRCMAGFKKHKEITTSSIKLSVLNRNTLHYLRPARKCR